MVRTVDIGERAALEQLRAGNVGVAVGWYHAPAGSTRSPIGTGRCGGPSKDGPLTSTPAVTPLSLPISEATSPS